VNQGRRPRGWSRLAIATALWLSALPVTGQFTAFQARPSAPPEVEGFEAVELGLEEALWDLGAVRLDPWIGIVDAGLLDNVSVTTRDDEVEVQDNPIDFRVVAGTGVRAYLPFGQHVIWAANAAEEYYAWVDDNDLNHAQFSWETRLFVHGNRVDLELGGGVREEQGYATSEIQQLTNSRHQEGEVALQIRLIRSMYLATGVRELDTEHEALREEESGSPVVSDLDRTEELYRAGLRFLLGSSIELEAGYQASETDFDATNRSNEATAPYLEFDYSGHNLALDFDVSRWDVEPKMGSVLAPFEETTSSVWLDLNPEGRVGVALYGSRDATYSVTDDFSHFVQTLYGVELSLAVTERVRLTVHGETGTDDYEPRAGRTTRREDDVVGFGGGIRVPLGRRLSLSLNGRHQEYDSDFPGAERDVSQLGLGFDFGLGQSRGRGWPSWP
jgi:hypothetical protein